MKNVTKNKKNKTDPKLDIDISTPFLLWKGLDYDAENHAIQTTKKTIETAPIPDHIKDYPLEASLVLGNDEMVQFLNNQYRNKNKPTNVLSFVCLDQDNPPPPPGQPFTLGDIIFSYQTIEREAQEQKKEFKDHFTHMIIHGTLHLLGYDHEYDKEAEEMESLEIHILKSMEIENPYL